MNYAALRLEFSPDPLSDTTPSWVDITRYCRDSSWFSGKQKDLDDPQAGGASFTLRNDQRRFEPEYAAGAYYPNVVPLRRFRASLVVGGVVTQQGVFYVTDWGVSYPGGTGYSEVVVTCVDGFGLLSLLTQPTLDPASASSLADVQAFDEPFAQYLLGDTGGTKMSAAVGTDGTYKNGVQLGVAGVVLGDSGTAVLSGASAAMCARVPLSDNTQFSDGDACTIEIVVDLSNQIGTCYLIAGPYNTAQGDHTFSVAVNGGILIATVLVNAAAATTALGSTTAAVHHLAVVWTGNALILYYDGVEVNRNACGGNLMVGDANDYLYVGGSTHASNASGGAGFVIQHAAFYTRALPASRIAAHATAALSRGYGTQTAGSRVASLAANPLWSTAGITTSAFQVAPRMMTGQSTLGEITETVRAEMPQSLFYFDESGNPAYQGWSGSSGVIAALIGDSAGEVPYTDLTLAYDDELYNDVTASRTDGPIVQAVDATSIAAYKDRSPSGTTDLILTSDADVLAVASEVLASFKDPRFRVVQISLNGANAQSRTAILNLGIGDVVRVRRRAGAGTTPIDVITTILGYAKSIDVHGNLVATLNLARGFNASDGSWRLGITGYSELDATTVLG